jgi:hypothetical protein
MALDGESRYLVLEYRNLEQRDCHHSRPFLIVERKCYIIEGVRMLKKRSEWRLKGVFEYVHKIKEGTQDRREEDARVEDQEDIQEKDVLLCTFRGRHANEHVEWFMIVATTGARPFPLPQG